MRGTRTVKWDSIERWSPSVFLIGGGLLVGHATLLGMDAFSSLHTPPDMFGPTGHLVALFGLFGLYSELKGRSPMVTRIAGGVALVGIVSWAALAVIRALTVLNFVSSVSDVLPSAFFGLIFVSTILTYVLFAIATYRADREARLICGLLLTPAALLALALVGSALADVSAGAGFLVGFGLAVSVLALGYGLPTWKHSANLSVPTGDVSVR